MYRLAVLCLALGSFAAPAAAEPVTLQFRGMLTSVDPDVGHALSLDDTFEFSLTYETVPRSTSFFFNLYDGTIAGRIGRYGFDSIRTGTGIQASKGSGDLYFENDFFSGAFGEALPGGWRGRALTFNFSDPWTTPGDLPTSIGPTAAMQFGFYYAVPDGSGTPPAGQLVSGEASSIRRIPEPGTLLLLGLGALGVVPRVARRFRQPRA